MHTEEAVKTLITRLMELIRDRYVFPEVGKDICDLLSKNLDSQRYFELGAGKNLARVLSTDLQSINQDRHLEVEHSADLVQHILQSKDPDQPEEESSSRDFGFAAIKRLEGNIGYLKLDEFAHTKDGGDAAVEAMQQLAGSTAVIFDLRENGGGSPTMVQLLTTYLFDHEPVHLNNFYMRETDSLDQFWILPYVPGERLIDAKVFVLTSRDTFSAAEEFSYNLQMLRRGTIIGETTGGGAHPGDDHVLNEHFSVFIPHGRAINPVSGTNWEGVGVKPDIEVAADNAFDTAYTKALDA